MKENKDYELIPSDEHAEVWNVRILTGDFVETVVRFGSISFNEVKDHLGFNFEIISSPIDVTTDDEDLQFVSARILEDIIDRGIEDGSVGMVDRKTGEKITDLQTS